MCDKADQSNLRPRDPFFELKERLSGRAKDVIPLKNNYIAVMNRDNTLHAGMDLTTAATRETE